MTLFLGLVWLALDVFMFEMEACEQNLLLNRGDLAASSATGTSLGLLRPAKLSF